MLTDYITQLLHKIAKNEGLVDYKIDTKSGSNHGDNFLGIMTAVTITGTKGQNGQTKSQDLHLICKCPPMNENRKKNFKSNLVFDREIFVYSKLLPAFVRFQREKGLSESESFLSFPKVYACETNKENDSYVLIMDDLRPKNYEMWPKEKIAPLDHQLYLMRELGKFHGISFAMKDQRPNEFDEYKQLKDTFSEIALHGRLKSFMNRSIDRAADVLKNPVHKKMMQNFRNTYIDNVDEILNGESSKEFAIVGHGDCWNNNFLFQYADDNKNKLKSICFLDWQISRYCPPVLDLLYNIFSSTDKQFRKDHYETLLKAYHSSLSEMIKNLGSDPRKLYTFENMESQMRKFGEFALLCGPMIIQLRVAAAKDVGNLDDYSELVEKGEEPDLINEFSEDTLKEYSTLINDLVTDLVNYGYVTCK